MQRRVEVVVEGGEKPDGNPCRDEPADGLAHPVHDYAISPGERAEDGRKTVDRLQAYRVILADRPARADQ